jgi:PAS domain S-box-containing protein
MPQAARAYVAFVIAAGMILVAGHFPFDNPRPVLFAVLAICACLTSVWKVTIPLGAPNGATLSVSYAADLMALMLLGVPHATLIALAGVWAQCTFRVKQRYPWYRTAFSMCAEAITITASGAAYSALGGSLTSLADLPKACVGTIATYFVVNTWLVAIAIGLSSRRSPLRIWADDFLWSGPSFMVAGTAGAIGALLVARENQWLAILVLAPVYLTYRTYQVFLGRIEDGRTHLTETQKLHGEAVEALAQARCAEQALAHEKERLAVTLRSIGDGVITTDLDGRIRLLNNVAEALTGWTQAEAANQPLGEVFQTFEADTRAPCDNSIEALTGGDGAGAFRSTILVARSMAERPIEEIAAPLRDGAGRTIGMVVAFRDITEALRMREERAKADRVASLGLLAGGIAHDFNQILMEVFGNVSMARAGVAHRSPAALALVDAERACLRARQLTWQLLTFSKGGMPTKTLMTIDQAVTGAARDTLRGTSTTCRLEIAPDLWPVSADEHQIQQVFNNLLLNAHQAMPHGGVIEIRAENIVEREERWEYALRVARGAYVRIVVSDHGIGIPPDQIGRIFDPYFTTKQKGCGLGLATLHSIVKHHGGFVTVQSTVGQGTSLAVHFPAAVDAAVQPTTAAAQPAITSRSRILILENEAAAQAATINMLALLGHDAEVVTSGQQAIEQYRGAMRSGHPYDAVILDLVAGGAGGAEMIDRLTKIDPHVNAIAATAYACEPLAASFRSHGFKGVINKPFTLQDLRSTIDAVLVTPRSWTVH